MKENIVLIGMPGCGKSSVGVVLAKVLGFRFIDSDLLIQEKEGRLLSEIIEEEGPEGFNRIENKINSEITARRAVIATGGSVVYGKEAMAHLRENGTVIYIRLPLEELENRLGDLTARGISMKAGQTLRDLYEERTPLYEKYTHLSVDVEGLSIRETVMLIREQCLRYIKTN